MYLEQELLKWGGIAGAGGAILGFVASVRKIGRSVKAARERKAKEAQAKIEYEKAVLDRLDAVCEKQTVMTAKQDALGTAQQELAAKLEDVQKDSAYLQMYELKQAYATYMAQGWCSPEARASIFALYNYYKEEKGRDSLADSFVDDLKRLPSRPPMYGRRATDAAICQEVPAIQ